MTHVPSLRLVLFLAAVALLLPACRGSLQLTPSDHETVLARQELAAPDPSSPGSWGVRTLYYGSGTDRNRPEYRDSVTLVTEPVDASKLVDLGSSAESRNGYWGFTPEAMPINGRVWYPDAEAGDGPFPLVLVVHGNHDMKDFSDPGYDYLGELLASRGFILASVDQNFINGGIRGENDARGWFLLKHLEAWEEFAEDAESPFRGLVDMERIALIGHSRGGEAVAVAAAFNRLERYPDDASLTFRFDFPIRGIVAIAPVDGQYRPTDRPTPVEDVSYLVFHGSHDGDVTSFHGLRQYNRLTFPSGGGHFKAAVYMYRANHGQWNTVWGAHDNGPRSGRILDLRYLIEPEKQRRMAEIYVTAFLESVLRDDDRWLPLFRDHRVAGEWLPETMYVTRFHDASFRALADFEEDIDVTSGSQEDVRIRGDSLATWKEETLLLRSSNRATTSSSQDNQAVRLAWNNRIEGRDTTAHGPPATYALELPPELPARLGLDSTTSLHLLLSATDGSPDPREEPDSSDATASSGDARSDFRVGRGEGAGKGTGNAGPGDASQDGTGSAGVGDDSRDGGGNAGAGDASRGGDREAPVDLTVEVEDVEGRTARVPLSAYGPIRRPLEIHISRRPDQERERFANLHELVLQSYTIPLSDFQEAAPGLDVSRLRVVRLVFDRLHAGEVVVDDIGFARLHPAYWTARVPPRE